jgi:HEAT repeat protein
MNRIYYTAALGAALLFGITSATGAEAGSILVDQVTEQSLIERLESSAVQTRGEALQEVVYLANVAPAGLDAESLVPVLLSIASRDGNSQFRIMAAQAVAILGNRADVRDLERIARRESSRGARRQMQLAAAAALNR